MTGTRDAVYRASAAGLILWIVGWLFVPLACAQDQERKPGLLFERPDLGPLPGVMEPNLPPAPGALQANPFSLDPGIIGGRRRGAARISRPGGRKSAAAISAPGAALPEPLPRPFQASAGAETGTASGSSLELALLDEGPPDGLTLDAAIERVVTANLDLQAIRQEIPQADADILTAGLRANPLLYMDTQFVPYGAFTDSRPGGPTQYDVNVTYPFDLSHKRQARSRVARAAKRVLEAQYQDVVRRQIANVSRAFVDFQAARINYKSTAASIAEQEEVVRKKLRASALEEKSLDSERLIIGLDKARAGLADARDNLEDAREALALLLFVPPEQIATIETRGRLSVQSPPPPPREELIRQALELRPDLVAARLGIARADSELRLANANRFDDLYLFYDPFSYQDNRPSKANSSRSWGLGVTFPVPIFNRNQGNIARAHGNLKQTHVELAALQRRVFSEVRQASHEYRSAHVALERIEKTILPHARDAKEKANAEFSAGKLQVDDYLGHLEDDADTARLYRDALVRLRRSMLDLNTAVGLRIFP